MTHHIHHTPGRLRLKFPQLKGRQETAQRVEVELHKVAGVVGAEANLVTGSVLVRYDQRKLDSSALSDAISRIERRLNHRTAPTHNTLHNISSRSQFGDRVIEIIVEKCIERAAMALLGSIL